MNLLSSSVSVTRYRVEGKLENPIVENVARRLKQNAIPATEDDMSEKTVGWTSSDNPFRPDFNGSSFVFGTYLVFSIRIDKKTIPPKIVEKHYAVETAKRLAESGRQYLSRSEKNMLKEQVIAVLSKRIPATPYVYDLLWNYEDAILWFFSNQKAANEELETLFSRSFGLTLIRLFPYTMADLVAGLSDAERDVLVTLSPTDFTE